MTECEQVRQRYERRSRREWKDFYSPLLPHTYLASQEKQRAIINWIKTCNIEPLESKRVLEIGCGSGVNLLELMQLGFEPENLVGNELLEERALAARKRLPIATEIICGDATEICTSLAPFDVVFQSTVFTSLLDHTFQKELATQMWHITKPGGGVLWYDFIYDNPRNPDVRGVPIPRIKQLFPGGIMSTWRLTLAPPISRRVTRIHPCLYSIFNRVPLLRTHVLCWIYKSRE